MKKTRSRAPLNAQENLRKAKDKKGNKRPLPKTPLGTPEDLQWAIIDWIDWDALHCPFMVTLTCHQHRGRFDTPLTDEKLKKQLRLFINRLNRAIMGNKAWRYKRRVYVLPAIEFRPGNLHGHLIIDCPYPRLEAEFPQLIRRIWKQCYWANQQIDVQKCYDGWALNYVTKIKDKPIYLDSYDWDNTHMPRKDEAGRTGLLSQAPSLTKQPSNQP